jgi:hypothetical protein
MNISYCWRSMQTCMERTLPFLKMTNFLDIIHCLSLIKNTRRFGDWGMSPSSGKKILFTWWRIQTPVSETSRVFDQGQAIDNVQKVCHFNNTPSSQTFRIYLHISLFCCINVNSSNKYYHFRFYNDMKINPKSKLTITISYFQTII